MSASSPETTIGFPCDPGLGFGHWLDDQLRLQAQIVESAAGNRFAAPINDNCRFKKIGRRNSAARRPLDRVRINLSIWFVAKNGDQS
jgi:hypothetical protein